MKTLGELTGDTETTLWHPTEAWADLILEASVCYGQLSGVITAMDYDVAAGNGNTVMVRGFPARTAQAMGAEGCNCLATTSSTLVRYPITINQIGDRDQMCGFSLWQSKGPVKEGILNEMAKGLAAYRDSQIWTILATRIGSYVTKSAVSCGASSAEAAESTYCCGMKYRKTLYNSIVSITQELRGGCKNPDTLIMHPSVAKHFYFMDANDLPAFGATFQNGKLATLNGLKVIETGRAAVCVNTSSTASVQAIVLDSSRAVGEAWGKRPEFYEDFVPQCNYFEEVIWMYWGCDTLDTNAYGWIRNP
jgi:hypothetical protein